MNVKIGRRESVLELRDVPIHVGAITLEGELHIPAEAVGIVLFAHGSGSSRHSPRNQTVARVLQESGTATLLFDLLTREEEAEDEITGRLRFDVNLLALRLIAATRWLVRQPGAGHLGLGYFGAGTGGAAALIAASKLSAVIDAVVLRGGRPDLAIEDLPRVQSPTLLIVGEKDSDTCEGNETAYNQLRCEKELSLIPHATHLFDEEGALEEVAQQAAAWFRRHLRPR